MTDEMYKKAQSLTSSINEAETRLREVKRTREMEHSGMPKIIIGTGNNYARVSRTTLHEILDKEEYIWGNLLRKYQLELKEL